MMKSTLFILFVLPLFCFGQVCSEGAYIPRSGDEVYLAFEHNGQLYYLDGVTSNGPRLVMRHNIVNRTGAIWRITYDENAGTFTFNSGGRGKYLDGITNNGNLTLRNNTSKAGTHWVVKYTGGNTFTFRAHSGGQYIWLSFNGITASLIKNDARNDNSTSTSGWQILKKD